MADEMDPPRKFYELKPRPFEVVNQPATPIASGGNPLVSPRNGKIEVQELYEHARTPGPVLTIGQKVAPPNQVHAVLQDNLARANAAGLNDLKPKPKRRSRRNRDFFIVAIPLNAFFGYAAFGPYSNVVTLAYGVGGMIIATLGIGWVMFGVMDDY